MCKGSQVLWIERDRLWKKWFCNRPTNVEVCSHPILLPVIVVATFKNNLLHQVLDISADNETTPEVNFGEKRKRSEEEEKAEHTSKKRKLQLDHDPKEGSSRSEDIIVIDIDVDVTKSADRPRSIQEEIDLTNKMVMSMLYVYL